MAEPKAIYPGLRGKTVLITGGASGIGACMVENFVQQGARVAFLDFDAEGGTKLARELGAAAHFEKVDLRDIAALRGAVEGVRRALGPIDVLDHSSRGFTYGSKMGIDATRKWPEEGFAREWPRRIEMDAGTKRRVDEMWGKLGIGSGVRSQESGGKAR